MGITIHYEGRSRNDEQYAKAIKAAESFAQDHGLNYAFFSEMEKELVRMVGQQPVTYTSCVKGIVVQPGEGCESLFLDFDEKGFMQNFCKTQSAGLRVHLLVIGLLRHVEPHLEDFKVTDESGYWDESVPERLPKKNFLERAATTLHEAIEPWKRIMKMRS